MKDNKKEEREETKLKHSTNKSTFLIIGILVVVFAGLLVLTKMQEKSKVEYDLSTIIPADQNSGGIEELVNGDPDAPVILVEYGDYQCTACAPFNPYVNELVEEYDGKLAVVFRTMIMSYHQNGRAAAAAALAANEQGYWKKYKDILYEKQDDWYESDAGTRQEQFEQYFKDVSGGKGDLEKFRADMQSEAVDKKISFDNNLSEKAGVEWTPYFTLDGELVSQRNISKDEFLNNLRAKIDAKLESQGIKK